MLRGYSRTQRRGKRCGHSWGSRDGGEFYFLFVDCVSTLERRKNYRCKINTNSNESEFPVQRRRANLSILCATRPIANGQSDPRVQSRVEILLHSRSGGPWDARMKRALDDLGEKGWIGRWVVTGRHSCIRSIRSRRWVSMEYP